MEWNNSCFGDECRLVPLVSRDAHVQTNFLTFDIEDWYMSYPSSQIPFSEWSGLECRVESTTLQILDMLDRMQQKATFFLLGWEASRFPDMVREISGRGHGIGYHSWDHVLPNQLSPDAFARDLEKGLALLSGLVGFPITQYRAPGFSFNRYSFPYLHILLQHGIQVSSSFKAYTPLGDGPMPNQPVLFETNVGRMLEFPLNRISFYGYKYVFSGSGYFRTLPFSVLKKHFLSGGYNMLYFHPRDFDVSVPSTFRLPWYRNVMNTWGNASSHPKLGRLIGEMAIHPLPATLDEMARRFPHLYSGLP